MQEISKRNMANIFNNINETGKLCKRCPVKTQEYIIETNMFCCVDGYPYISLINKLPFRVSQRLKYALRFGVRVSLQSRLQLQAKH